MTFNKQIIIIAIDFRPLSKDDLALGQLQQEDMCLQSQNSTVSKSSVILAACAPSKTEQVNFSFLKI